MSEKKPAAFTMPTIVSLKRKHWKELAKIERTANEAVRGDAPDITARQAADQVALAATGLAVNLRDPNNLPKEEDLKALAERMTDLAAKLVNLEEYQKRIEAANLAHEEWEERIIREYYPGVDFDDITNENYLRIWRATLRKTRGEELGN